MKQTIIINKFTSNQSAIIQNGLETEGQGKARSLEDAIALTGHGKYHYLALFGVGLCVLTMIFETVGASYLLPSAQCDFNLSNSDKGVLNAAVFLGMIVSSHIWGFLADTKGRRKLLIITLLLNSICTITASLSPTFVVFVVIRFFNGIFVCCASAVSYAYLGEFHAAKTRTKALLWATAFLFIATILLPLLAWAVIPQTWIIELPWCLYKSWRIFMLFCTAPGIIAALFLWFLMYESPKFLLVTGKDQEALQVLKKIYALNTGSNSESYPVTSLIKEDESASVTELDSPRAVLKSMWNQTTPIFIPPYLRCTILACWIQFGLYASSNGFLLWLPDLFNRMEEYKVKYPNDTLTVCKAVDAYSPFSLVDMAASKSLNGSIEPSGSIENNQPFVDVVLKFSAETINVTDETAASGVDDVRSPVQSCSAEVNMAAFQNTLIIGVVTLGALFLVNFAIDRVQKRVILCLSGVMVCVINSVVIEVFPTHLRAMALCLSLMMGRVGTGGSNLVLGALLEINCALVIFLLGGIVAACGVMSVFLPSAKNENQEENESPR